jgi:ribosome-binding factor A
MKATSSRRSRSARYPGLLDRDRSSVCQRSDQRNLLMKSRRSESKPLGSYARTARINELLREVLAEELERFADTDERLRLPTVTGVEVTADLSSAKVYMSSVDEPVSEALTEHRAHLQRAIGRQVRMKRTPKLQFVPDPAVAEGAKVEEILRRLKSGRSGEADGIE